MRGTLADGDALEIAPVAFDALQPGDIVAFDSGGQVVVHRIVGRTPAGFRTQGDGNWSPDSRPLTPGNLIGRVVARERGGVRTEVAGGRRGRRRGMFLRAAGRMRLRLRFRLRTVYRLLRARRLISRIWRPRILAVRFSAPAGPVTKYIHRGRTVARWMPRDRHWECRVPYDLVLSPPAQ